MAVSRSVTSTPPPWLMGLCLLLLNRQDEGSALMTFTQGLHYTSIIQLKDLLNLIFQVAKRPDHLSYGTSGRLCVEHNCCPVVILAVRVCKEAYSHVGAQSNILDEKYLGFPCSRYINSPGGSVTAGLAIYDTMQSVSLDYTSTKLNSCGKDLTHFLRYVHPPISTWCVGQACSMGSLLLAAGTQGMRHSLPNSR